ncbi:beta-lactamase family protein (plasmid) [Streptomyces sp. NBC_00715]|uniref:serine hydrolase domain-containing protein n=1 Tax=Streptomyces sp. NBC_00715 TaxID=2975811 RepID=UPI00386F6E94
MRDQLLRLSARMPMAGAQITVSRHGERLLEASLGEAQPGVPMSNESALYLSCAGKPLLAVTLGSLVDAGRIRFEDKVCVHLPAFSAGGKGDVTVADVLSHAGGFRNPGPVSEDYTAFVEHVLALPLESGWVPGRDQGYHRDTGWYVIAALVESLLRQDYRTALERRVCEPLALDATWASLRPETYAAVRDRLAVPTIAGDRGLRAFPYVASRVGAQAKIPSYGYYGTTGNLASFYEAALACLERDAPFPVSRRTLSAMTTPPRGRVHDLTLKYSCSMGLGFLCDLSGHYGFGDSWSPKSFGASGLVGQTYAGADPTTGVVVVASFGALMFDLTAMTALLEELYAAAVY